MASANGFCAEEGNGTGNDAESAMAAGGRDANGNENKIGCLEIVTEEWKVCKIMHDDDLLGIKENRAFGASRSKKKNKQAPMLKVRLQGSESLLQEPDLALRARLWNFGPVNSAFAGPLSDSAFRGTVFDDHDGKKVDLVANVVDFGKIELDGHRYAILRSVITRGVRVACRKNDIALKLECVRRSSPDVDASTLVVLPFVNPIRTRRISVSEKAMCPRKCDMQRQKSQSSCSSRAVVDSSSLFTGQKRSFQEMTSPSQAFHVHHNHQSWGNNMLANHGIIPSLRNCSQTSALLLHCQNLQFRPQIANCFLSTPWKKEHLLLPHFLEAAKPQYAEGVLFPHQNQNQHQNQHQHEQQQQQQQLQQLRQHQQFLQRPLEEHLCLQKQTENDVPDDTASVPPVESHSKPRQPKIAPRDGRNRSCPKQ